MQIKSLAALLTAATCLAGSAWAQTPKPGATPATPATPPTTIPAKKKAAPMHTAKKTAKSKKTMTTKMSGKKGGSTASATKKLPERDPKTGRFVKKSATGGK